MMYVGDDEYGNDSDYSYLSYQYACDDDDNDDCDEYKQPICITTNTQYEHSSYIYSKWQCNGSTQCDAYTLIINTCCKDVFKCCCQVMQ